MYPSRPGMGPAPLYLVNNNRAPKEIREERIVRSCGPGKTPPSRTDLDKELDDGKEKTYSTQMQTLTKKEKNMDNGKDLVECEVCHRKFKGRRGIKIHLSKSKCGRVLEASQRKIHKSEEHQSLEENHSATVIHRRRLPFIVSQTYHRNKSPQKQHGLIFSKNRKMK